MRLGVQSLLEKHQLAKRLTPQFLHQTLDTFNRGDFDPDTAAQLLSVSRAHLFRLRAAWLRHPDAFTLGLSGGNHRSAWSDEVQQFLQAFLPLQRPQNFQLVADELATRFAFHRSRKAVAAYARRHFPLLVSAAPAPKPRRRWQRAPFILNLDAPEHLQGTPQERQLAFLRQLNRDHAAQHPGELDLEARISTYELAARMQTAAKEALDLSRESEATKQLYGLDRDETRDYATRCLIARRLVERGVRFVQVLNHGQSWDHHGGLINALPASCRAVDQPCAALVKDLKARGLLDSTIVHWGGEMGRLPVMQNDSGPGKAGRDHNTYGFSQWVAGGGFKGGCVHGETDEWGHRAVKDVVNHYDWHATLLHCFGLDHETLTYKRNGLELSLTDKQGARVVKELLQG